MLQGGGSSITRVALEQDVWGAVLADALAGKPAFEIVERDDGFVIAFDATYLFAPFAKWDDPDERRAMRFVRGRVLDVGCGGGRVCLHLQARGLDVVGIDSSPGAIDCCGRRGVQDARLLAIGAVDTTLGSFDTLVFLGQNFGMVGSHPRARRLLARLRRVTTRRGRIVAETFDPIGSPIPSNSAISSGIFAAGVRPGSYGYACATATYRRRGSTGFSSPRMS